MAGLTNYDLELLKEVSCAQGYGYYLTDVIDEDRLKSVRLSWLIEEGYIEARFTADNRSIIRLTNKGRFTIKELPHE